MGLFDSLKDAAKLVSGKKFTIQYYDMNDNLKDIKELSIPDINMYLMGKDNDDIVITIIEK